MNLLQEKALYHLTGRTDQGPTSLAAIQKLAEEYPYFAPAQSLLASQFRKDEHPMVVLQTIKTALYFTNPYWLQYQLQNDFVEKTIHAQPSKPVSLPAEESSNPITDRYANNADHAVHPLMAGSKEFHSEPLAKEAAEDIVSALTDGPFPEAKEPVIVPAPPEPAKVNLTSSNLAIPTIEAVREMMRNIDPATEEEKQANETLPEADHVNDVAEEPAAIEAENKISSLLSDQLADFKKPLDPEAKLDLEVTHEKLHTVDYFASQGIKVDLSAIPQDKLTTHLRKFTDWLRQMKQGELNAKDLVANLEMEQQVAKTAQHSNETKEVITEAMAEVLEKQGHLEKAIEVYEKLSFLNPEKSSYFASKIEHLKGI